MAEAGTLVRKISGINWNQVYYFSLVASIGSIRAAAEALELSPSTLSEHISQLEKDLEVRLFHRNGPKLTLSDQGQKLFLHAKGMFENGHRLLDVVAPAKVGAYPISVGFVPGAHLLLAQRFMCSFLKRHGTMDMKFHHCTQAELEGHLRQSKFDFGFSDQLPGDSDLRFEMISKGQIRFYVSAEWRDRSLSEILKEIPLLLCRSDSSTDAAIEKSLQEAEISVFSKITSDYPAVIVELCRKGLGVGAFFEEPVQQMNSENIKPLRSPKDAPRIEANLYAIWSGEAERSVPVARLKSSI